MNEDALSDLSGGMETAAGIMKTVGIVSAIFTILMIVAMWKIYVKAGKPGWASIVPIYNIIVFLEIIGKPWWWLLIMFFVPIANFIFLIWSINLLSKSFGKGVGFTIGLLVLGPIFILVLAFGGAKYAGPAGKYIIFLL
jgi:hypothetical protein